MPRNLGKCFCSCLLTIGASMVVMGTACKPIDESSDTQSIEAILGRSVANERRCGPGRQDDDGPWQAVEQVLQAAPPPLRSLLPPAQDLVIFEPDQCQSITGMPAPCWGPSNLDGAPIIYLKPDVSFIHANLLQMTAYIFVEFLIDRLPAALAELPDLTIDIHATHQFVQSFVVERQKLTDTLINELKNVGHQQVLNEYANALDIPVDELGRSVNLQNFFFAELYDAFYCSQSSFAMFEQEHLPKTRLAFAWFADLFGDPWFAGIGVSSLE